MTDAQQEQQEQELAEEFAEVEAPAADVMAGIVGEEFGIEMVSVIGGRWVWIGVDPEVAQEVYKRLGEPTLAQPTQTDQEKPLAMPPGDDPRAGHPTTRQM